MAEGFALGDLVARLRLDLSEAQGSVSKAAALGGAVGAAVGGVVGNLAAVGIGKVKDFFGDSISAASDLNETISKVGVLFGPAQAQIEEFANGAATSIGQSKQQAMDAAATFAVFGKSAGLQVAPLATFSTKLTGLASDMASFSNTSPQEAIDAIGSALRGETEPIRKYGVLIDDASTRQEAMRLGITKTTKDALTPQQRVLAVQSLILKQTSAAQGDFARTSTGLANSQRIASAEAANARAELGQRLLPAQLALTRAAIALIPVVAAVVGALTAWGSVIGRVVSFVRQNIDAIGPLVAVIGALVVMTNTARIATAFWTAVTRVATIAGRAMAAMQAALNAVMSLNPIGLVILALVALVAAFVLAYRHSATFRAIVQGAWAGVRAAVASAMPIIRAVFAAFSTSMGGIVRIVRGAVNILVGLFTGDFGRVKAGAMQVLGGLVQYFRGIPAMLLRALGNLGSTLLGAGADLIRGFVHGIESAAGDIIGAIRSAITDRLPGFVKKALGINSPSRVFAELGRSIPEGMAQGILSGQGAVQAAMASTVGFTAAGHAVSSVRMASAGPGAAATWAPYLTVLDAISRRPIHVHLDGRKVAETQNRRLGVLLDDTMRR